MQNNNTIYWAVGALIVLVVAFLYYNNINNNSLAEVNNEVVNTQNVATNTMINENDAASDTASDKVLVDLSVKGKVIGGYPSSWPSDVPKYPNGIVLEKAGNNPKSLPAEALVVFTTKDSVKTVVGFYLKGLIANGWKITEDGAGTGNMTTFRAVKGKRSVGGYAVYENGKTEVSLGVNQGM